METCGELERDQRRGDFSFEALNRQAVAIERLIASLTDQEFDTLLSELAELGRVGTA